MFSFSSLIFLTWLYECNLSIGVLKQAEDKCFCKSLSMLSSIHVFIKQIPRVMEQPFFFLTVVRIWTNSTFKSMGLYDVNYYVGKMH